MSCGVDWCWNAFLIGGSVGFLLGLLGYALIHGDDEPP